MRVWEGGMGTPLICHGVCVAEVVVAVVALSSWEGHGSVEGGVKGQG